MEVKIVEHNELIAVRIPVGDNWELVNDSKKIVHRSLTEALEAYFHKTGFKGSYRLDPLDSKLYAIQVQEEEIQEEKPKEYGIYDEIGKFRQGI
jgi:hypothetical protein